MVWYTKSDDVRVVAGTYQFFTDAIPSAAGFEYLIESPANPNDLGDPYYAQFNQENRFINFANNLGTAGVGATEFAQEYGALTFDQMIRKAYDVVVGNAQAQAAGINVETAVQFFIGAKSFYEQVAQERVVPGGVPLDQATKIVALGSIINEAIKSGIGKYADAVTALVADVTPDGLSTLLGTSIVTQGGATFVMTPGQDTADQQGAFRNGNNPFDFKFTGTDNETVQASNTTLTVGDSLSDPSTTDKDVVQIDAQGGTQLNLRSMLNLEMLNVSFTTYNGGNVIMTGVKGAQELHLSGTLTNATPDFTGIETTGIKLVDGSGLTGTQVGFQVIFQNATDNISRTIIGGAGPDVLGGSPVADNISGGAGNDLMNGFGGTNTLRGGAGNDTIIAGGTGDTVVFEATAEANGKDILLTGPGGFQLGANGDKADFTAFIGGPANVLEVPVNTLGGAGVDATGKTVIIFDNDPAIDTEQEIEASIGSGVGKLFIGADRDVVVIIQHAGSAEAYYVSTNAAGQVTPDDVDLVATFNGGVSNDFIPTNFV